MHIYLINLSRRPDRLAQMDIALKALGLPYTRIAAIDGADADIGQPKGHRMPKAAYACYLSHLKAYRAFLDSGETHCVIMEDDMVLSPRLPEALTYTDFFPNQNTIVRLEAPTNQFWKLPTYSLPKKVAAHNGLAIYKLISTSYGTGAFVLPRALAQSVIKHQSTFDRPIDLRLFDKKLEGHLGFDILQISPALAIQKQYLFGEDESDILQTAEQEAKQEKGHPMLQNLKANLRVVFRVLIRPFGFIRTFPFAKN